jgi:hypothetical protein
MDLHTTHLGHPLILPTKNRSAAYAFIVDRFKSKLTAYKANRLSHAARLTLIKSVFASIPFYYMSTILLNKKLIAKLTSIVRKFWWTGIQSDQNCKPLCLPSWDEICKPIREGGLGVRNLHIMNLALIASSAWRIIKEPNSLLAAVLKAKYFPHTSIWRTNTNLPKSAFWSSVLKVLPLMQSSIYLQIAKGNSSIWSSPWCPDWQNIYDHLLTQPGSACPAIVKDLWHHDTKQWDEQKIASHFDNDFRNKVLQISIVNADFDDEVCWVHTSNAQCTTKSAYKCFLQVTGSNSRELISAQEKRIWWEVWTNKKLAPRVKTFAWRLIKRALATGGGARASKSQNTLQRNVQGVVCLKQTLTYFFIAPLPKPFGFVLQ